ncbi:hypothetical protein C0Q70_20372 [Pomacea canaliculata]|uniref:FIST C-domain domain-containing protein n=2 Tax=Pomacea canaliculata TaxID=400727 RepID=A0A2T7NFC3_POMCA|nr:hypothetical protein C0Q70_20372 [Pomacea canaliculata]
MARRTPPNLSSVLTFPQVAKVILSCLPAKTIYTSARLVCKTWNTQADVVLQRRRQYYWDIFQPDQEKDADGCYQKIKDFFEKLPVRPEHVIIFCSSKLWESKIRSFKQATKVTFSKAFQRLLPLRCKVSCIVTDGVIGTSSDLKQTLELEQNDVQAASVLCFGKPSGLELRSLKLNSAIATEMMNHVKRQRGSMPQELASVSKDLKTLLAFSEDSCETEIGQTLYKALGAPLIAGAIVKTLSMGPAHKDEVLSCLGFCGADIQTASVMFSMQVDTSEEAEKVAARLRQKVVGMPLKNSIAFMFACVGRGEYHYGLPSVESSAFRKYFPDTPLLGLFGNGETGYEFPIEGDVGDIPRMFHAYTTAVVLLCLP